MQVVGRLEPLGSCYRPLIVLQRRPNIGGHQYRQRTDWYSLFILGSSLTDNILILPSGAMSWAFIHTMKEHPGQSYVAILQRTRALLSPKYAQIPQLSVRLSEINLVSLHPVFIVNPYFPRSADLPIRIRSAPSLT
jgi:hypothetical protein